jgi:hypothetical protein
LALDNKTVDKVATGEQQPEADHQMKCDNSKTGTHQGEFYRDAGECSGGDGGYISYLFETNEEDSLSLMVRYWGNESCTRTFDIMIDDDKLVTENIVGKWNKSDFVNETYPIPDAMVKGKKEVRITFKASSGMVGGIFEVRLLRNKPKPEKTTSLNVVAEMSKYTPDLNARIVGDNLQVVASGALPRHLSAKIYATDGRLVKAQVLSAGQSDFNIGIADLKKGMYVLRIQQDGLKYVNTIFKKTK